MKLYYSNTSPYSRKVRIVIIEKGLQNTIEQVLVNPFENDATLQKINPLGKIPALLLNNGNTLYNSPLVAQYLDSLNNQPKLCPQNKERWAVLKYEALADGIIDAAYNLVMETRRKTCEQSPHWIENWQNDIKRALTELENTIATLGETLALSHIAIATAIGYLQFRLPQLLPNKNTKTMQWFIPFSKRESMVLTQPKD